MVEVIFLYFSLLQFTNSVVQNRTVNGFLIYCLHFNQNRGKPLDEIDAVCQTHSKCQQCVYADSNGEINPKSTGYVMTIDKDWIRATTYAIFWLSLKNY